METREPMRFAYADPPYFGTAAKTYGNIHPDAAEYDNPEAHRRLIERLEDEFPDGWALSLNEPSLPIIAPMAPKGARFGAWISNRPKFPPSATIGRHWEPVIWRGGRGGKRRCGDFLVTHRGGAVRSPEERAETSGQLRRYHTRVKSGRETFGGKPREFSRWIFDLLGAGKGDEFHDLFPGSGGVSSAWAERIGAQPDLPLTPLEEAAND